MQKKSYMDSIKRYLIIASILALAISPFFLLPRADTKQKEIVRSRYEKALINTFRVESRKVGGDFSIGTGIILQNGLLLTSRHLIDVSGNGNVDLAETRFRVFDGIGNVYSATVIYQPMRDPPAGPRDWCLAYVVGLPCDGTKIAWRRPLLGEEIFTIGSTDGGPLNLYCGVQSLPRSSLFERASMAAYFGNSGGGVFNENAELVGLVTRMQGSSKFDMVPHVFEYISIDSIKRQLYVAGKPDLLD
jgi:S1-C subfamily serine protease